MHIVVSFRVELQRRFNQQVLSLATHDKEIPKRLQIDCEFIKFINSATIFKLLDSICFLHAIQLWLFIINDVGRKCILYC